jgi:hypothetical protein
MASTVTQATITTITSNSYETLSVTLGIIVILLLFALLCQKELVRAWKGPQSEMWMQTLNIAIAPLLASFGAIMILRLVDLLSAR